MLRLGFLWLQLLSFGIISWYWQYLYIENYFVQIKQSRQSIYEIYHDIKRRVRSIDQQLERLATINSTNINDNINRTNETYPSMLNADELIRGTMLKLNINNPCNGKLGIGATLLVLMYNRANDMSRRMVIRNTYGGAIKRHPKSFIYFVVARDLNSSVQDQLNKESKHYNDIIQLDYVDNYNRLTIKSIAIMRWIALNCPFVQYAFKFDDDSFLRLNPLIQWLKWIKPKMIYGELALFTEAVRSNTSKWYIASSYYSKRYYPTYAMGLYLFPGTFAIRLYETVVIEPIESTIPALPFEDVYMTGIVASKARIERSHLNVLTTSKNMNDTRTLSQYIVFYNHLCPCLIKHLWNLFEDN